MTRFLHSRSKIFFANPYVVRIEYEEDMPMHEALVSHRQLMRRTYKLISNTWGYSSLEYEQVQIKNDNNQPAPVAAMPASNYNGINPSQIFVSLFDSGYTRVLRGYLCFVNESDALQFRLMTDTNSVRVHMWPEGRFFTIHEFIGE